MLRIFEELENKTLRGRIADRIQEAILDGSLKEGERLVERRLASQFGTSLTAVREALIEMESEGFVTKKPNSATYVTKLSLMENEKIFALREVLEAFAMEEACRLATPELIAQVEKAYLEMTDAARARDVKLFLRRDFALHEAIWRICDNEYLHSALRRIVLPQFGFAAIRFVTHSAFDLLNDAYSHLALVEALKARDPEAGRKALLAGLDEWASATRDYLFGGPDSERGRGVIRQSAVHSRPGHR